MLTHLLNVNMKMIEAEGIKENTMAQWINLVKKCSVLWMPVAFIVLKTGPIHQVLVDPMAGRPSSNIKAYHF